MLTSDRMNQIIKGAGWRELPTAGVTMYSTNHGRQVTLVVQYRGDPLPTIFYFEEGTRDDLEVFKAIRPKDLR
jgi:hypothetical protein